MSFTLTAEELVQKAELAVRLQQGKDAVTDAIAAYNAIVEEAEQFRVEVHDRLENEFNEKPESWQVKADAAQEMIAAWDIELEPLAEADNDTAADGFGDLPDSSEPGAA
jgi:hypothetical protein